VSDRNTRPDHAFLQLRHQQCAAGDIFRGPVDCPFQWKDWQIQTVEGRLRVEKPSVRSARVLSAGADRFVDRLAVGAVSYTHLDVYKRQPRWIHPRRTGDTEPANAPGKAVYEAALQHAAAAVRQLQDVTVRRDRQLRRGLACDAKDSCGIGQAGARQFAFVGFDQRYELGVFLQRSKCFRTQIRGAQPGEPKIAYRFPQRLSLIHI